jgi:formamidopyrimidine-DNA glycosylase
MIELPEALHIANQINDTVHGRRIVRVTAGHTPHKLAWYYGERSAYSDLLAGKKIGKARAYGGMVEIKVEKANILFGEGVGIRFLDKGVPLPPKHQLMIEFEDSSALCVSIQMYGGLGVFREGELENPYYMAAKQKISPYSTQFDLAYFNRLLDSEEAQKLSLKAFLATEQRIPGLGNGVLQDILWNAKMHPKTKAVRLSVKDREALFNSVTTTLRAMAVHCGRDTEFDLFGHPGGYTTVLCKKTINKPCPDCGTAIKKEAYMGGSIYFCGSCQPIR